MRKQEAVRRTVRTALRTGDLHFAAQVKNGWVDSIPEGVFAQYYTTIRNVAECKPNGTVIYPPARV